MRAGAFVSSNPSTWTTSTEPHFFPSLHSGNSARHFLFPAPQPLPPRAAKRQREDRPRPSPPPAMEREVTFRPKWPRALWFLLLTILCFAKSEITCRSCQRGNHWRARELLLKLVASEPATGLKGEVFGQGAAGDESRRQGYAEPGPDPDPSGEAGETAKVSRVSGSALAARRRRSAGDGNARRTGEGEGSGRRTTRSELRWSGEERRAAAAAAPRQEGLKLNSSTFALTGDSSHNQAMVHWSGQNSSVSDFIVLSITGGVCVCVWGGRTSQRGAARCVCLHGRGGVKEGKEGERTQKGKVL